MLLVAVAWIYVVGLMAATQPTILAGFFTFLFYCVVPLSILFYLTGGRRRRAKRERLARMGGGGDQADLSPTSGPGGHGRKDHDRHDDSGNDSSDSGSGDGGGGDGGGGGD